MKTFLQKISLIILFILWLNNRGYAVLSVNFRGSVGMGKNFVNAANRQWSKKMQDDLIDAVNWSIDNMALLILKKLQ